MKQLERLLLFQGNRCFFCDLPIPEGEASVEHLVATASGGTNDDDNCVACCRALNAAFGSRPYKEKLRAILSHRGKFTCPNVAAPARTVDPPTNANAERSKLAPVIADLQKRGSARPRKVATLRNTIAAVFQKKISEQEVQSLFESLLAAGYIVVNGQSVSYNLPKGA